MALRDDRERGRAVPAQDGPVPALSAAEVGRSLRMERIHQGLSLKDVSIRTGIPEEQLRAAETGVLDPEDSLATLRIVRRYAGHLGLPGDHYALAILDQSPTPARALRSQGTAADTSARASNRDAQGPDTWLIAEVRTGPIPLIEPGRAVGVAPMDGAGVLTDDYPTMTLPVVASLSSGSSDAQFLHDPFSDTGVNPALPRGTLRGAPVGVRALIVIVVVAVLAGVALLALDRLHPAWLRDVGLLKRTSVSQPAVTRHARAVAPPAASVRHGVQAISDDEVLVDAEQGPYTVVISAVGGPCWVEVTTAASSTPLSEGIVEPGTVKSLVSARNIVVLLGSAAGRFSLTSKAVRVLDYRPKVAPMKILVNSSK